jgi:hypothetical protein
MTSRVSGQYSLIEYKDGLCACFTSDGVGLNAGGKGKNVRDGL